jgi:CRISPR-associated Cas5-like protein
MPVVVVEAVAPVGSWRPPEALTYHRTLPLPPYTSLVGMLGAAAGLGLPAAYRFVADQNIRLGVGGWHEGQGRDLWKFQKLESIEDQKKEIKTDVLLREFWTDVRLALVIEVPDASVAGTVADAFRRPAFPLTAGTSDALMHAVDVRVEEIEPRPTRRLAYCLTFGELSVRYTLAEPWNEIPLNRVIRAPSVERLPTGFAFEDDQPRRLLGRELVTFVTDPIELDPEIEAVSGYPVEPRSPALRVGSAYGLLKKGLPWTIPVHRYDSTPMPAIPSSTPPSPSGKTKRRGS